MCQRASRLRSSAAVWWSRDNNVDDRSVLDYTRLSRPDNDVEVPGTTCRHRRHRLRHQVLAVTRHSRHR